MAYRCGFNEIYTYPWIDIKYIKAAKINTDNLVRLATPPAPELANLRSSLIPGLLEAVSKNLRYNDNFKLFELAQVFEKGEYHESTEEETLPIHKNYLTGAIVSKDAKSIFYEMKGVLEDISKYTHMEGISLVKGDKPSWADINANMNIILNDEVIGSTGLVSLSTLNESKIKHSNVALFELNFDALLPLPSRTNKYETLPIVPLVEKDLSLLVNEETTWKELEETIRKRVYSLEFIEEYRGNQIPEGKKSITLRLWLGNGVDTMKSEDIEITMNGIIRALDKRCGATIREE